MEDMGMEAVMGAGTGADMEAVKYCTCMEATRCLAAEAEEDMEEAEVLEEATMITMEEVEEAMAEVVDMEEEAVLEEVTMITMTVEEEEDTEAAAVSEEEVVLEEEEVTMITMAVEAV
ncbi:unnamed protein product [Acanthoscelides obtectus]|uniref:Uncharacterized protein n=1 Tax=Acanthoscelides obtectus TaxID=200917 RepID=A0A9P0LGV0_ACAOB|nr:unnamed protein product [Acanthoscelides obtectus]CAK1645971.1 hypothetical protein AOBTE_LOCUS14367 [Acanthoscelides obtectus]